MKKGLFYLSLLAFPFLMLTACGGGGTKSPEKPPLSDDSGEENGNEDGGSVENTVPEGTIYSDKAFPALVYKDGDVFTVTESVNAAREYMKEHASVYPALFKDTGARLAHEIVFGDTSREISAVAKGVLSEKLEAAKAELVGSGIAEDDISGYLVYSNGSSAAVVWTDFQLAEEATNYFLENYASEDSLLLAAGYTDAHFTSLRAFLEEREARIFDEKWAALAAAIPEEYREDIITELKRMYSLYDDKAVEWLASLFDPEIGGWYVAESARDTEGYLPDIEHTYSALNLVATMGMAEMFGGRWERAMPRDILEKVGSWIISLQDEDGYYYHPQWPKDFIERNGLQSRITRDKGSAEVVLDKIGMKPTYSGYRQSESKLTGKLGTKKVAAVSKAVSAASLLSQFESNEAYSAYIAKLEAKLTGVSDTKHAYLFYEFGNEFQSTVSLMNDDMKRMTIEFLDRHQNPENGMWSQGLYYDSTNGIHKIASVYNAIGAELKYAEKIIDSTLEVLKWDVHKKPVSTTCEIYNVWSCFPYIYKNIRNCSSGTVEEKNARCEAMKARVFAGAAEAIFTTYEQMLDFRKENGSFSYLRNHSLDVMQGCPCAVPGTNEGDIAGYTLAVHSMPHFILAALELDAYGIPAFTEQDRLVYIDAIRNAQPVVKEKK